MGIPAKLMALILGGSLGTVLRYGLGLGMQHWMGTWLPYGTFAANMLGCLLMGVFLALSEEAGVPSPWWRLMIGTGFLGALTTFSTLELDTFLLARGGAFMRMSLYLGASLILGLGLLWLGYMAVRGLLPVRS